MTMAYHSQFQEIIPAFDIAPFQVPPHLHKIILYYRLPWICGFKVLRQRGVNDLWYVVHMVEQGCRQRFVIG